MPTHQQDTVSNNSASPKSCQPPASTVPKLWVCRQCSKSYGRRDYLARHALTHDRPSHECPTCAKSFFREDVLRKHVAQTCRGDRSPKKPTSQRSSTTQPRGGLGDSESGVEEDHDNMRSLPTSSTPTNIDASFASIQAGGSRAPAPGPEMFMFDPGMQTGSGDNVDGLLTWLFNTSPDNMAFTSMAGVEDASALPPLAPSLDESSCMASYGAPTLPTRISTPQPPLPPPPPPLRSSRAPQPINPLHVPNISKVQVYPVFSKEWAEKGHWAMPGREDILNEGTREKMLGLIDDDTWRNLSATIFSLPQMQLYLELYFLHLDPLYPIIHRPSMGYRSFPPDLLLTMVCIGTAFAANGDGLELACSIHKKLRTRIFEKIEDDPIVPLSSLQTLLLINHFARTYCSLKQHDVAQVFHSPSIILARLSGVFLPRFERPRGEVTSDPMAAWLDWVQEEERKRLGWFAFMVDTGNAALYRHYLLTHCFSIQTDFPTTDPVWQATDPITWSQSLHAVPPTPTFRHSLRELIGRGNILSNLTDTSLWILLHGLISVSWSLLWRDMGDLSMVHDSKVGAWKDSMRRAFDKWRGEVSDRLALKANRDALDTQVYWVGIPFAQLGVVLLLTDTEQIRIFAGADRIASRPISPGEWAAANKYVGTWARSQDAAYSCWAALQLLSEVYRWSGDARFSSAPSIVPWSLYIASLVVWTYTSVLDGHDNLRESYIIPVPSTHATSPPSARIEPSLALRGATAYLAKMLACSHPFELADIPGKNKCAPIIAYTAHITGGLIRGTMEECRTVLVGLLLEYVEANA
ncbi:hypothetical protein IAT38_007939 [Cryptococcus sp. DSM 104549]